MQSEIQSAGSFRPILGLFGPSSRRVLARVAQALLRGGLIVLLLMWGSFKFTAFEAEGIRPLIENSPLLSWMYPVFGVRGASEVIGVVEMSAALLMATRPWAPRMSAVGSLLAAGTFLVTLSFLVTTPGALAPDSSFGGFLMKDILLLGAALFTAAEALGRAAVRD